MKYIKFKDFITLQRGFDLPKNKRVEGEYPLVTASTIDGSHNECKVRGPGVVTGRSGTLGQVQYVDDDFWPLNTTLWVKDFKGNDPRYVYYYLKTLKLDQYNSGAGVPTLNRNHLDTLDLSVHDLVEQSEISRILGTLDNLIENNTRRIAILEEMAQAIYREWFVEFKAPGLTTADSERLRDGEVISGWRLCGFGDLVDFVRTSVQKGTLSEPTPYMGLEHLPRHSITLSAWEMVSEIGSSKLAYSEGDILFGKIRPYFHKVGIALNHGICSSDTFVFRAKPKLHSLSAMIASSEAFVAVATQTSQGTKMPRANWDVLSEYPVLVPPDHLLDKFDDLCQPIFAELKLLATANKNLVEQRDLLLPKLISGQIELS